MYYHGSPEGGIKILEPKVSMHGEAYVYLCINKVHATIYAARSFIYPYVFKKYFQLIIHETYPGYLEETFSMKSGYVYAIAAVKGVKTLSRIPFAYATRESVEIDSVEYIPDLLAALLEYEKQCRLIIHRYPDMSREQLHRYNQKLTESILENRWLDSTDDYPMWIREKFPRAWADAEKLYTK